LKSSYPATRRTIWNSGLSVYIKKPERYPDTVIFENSDFVVIKDRYPKSLIHWLILPRDDFKTAQHPFEAFKDQDFLDKTRELASDIQKKAVAELEVLRSSKLASTESTLSKEVAQQALASPQQIQVGIHAVPSMSNLHIHIISRDMLGRGLKRKSHYQSFNSPFFVPLSEFPLTEDDERLGRNISRYLKEDLICWKCHKNYGSGLQQLLGHLESEDVK
jgi:aprataxin